jgi:LPXTG-motif cell wall-anchored protein
MRAARRVLAVAAAAAFLIGGSATGALAHEERESVFPPGTGSTPSYRPFSEATPRLVVCKPESKALISRIADPKLRAFNQRLLGECRFAHMQAAVDAVTERGTNIYVLPGVYREEPSHNPPCARDYDGGVVDYPLIVSCGEVINLVTIAGDRTVDTAKTDCNQLCDLQIEGTGARMEDVVLRGGFTEDKDWIKHNGIKADRADGFRIRNMTLELFRENALYVHETDGYLIDRVNARHNDLYGILTFTSDHGVISNCDTSFNGDSGVYPGSAADVNATNPLTGPLKRFAVEIFGCKTHHNALGFSGTAGNSVYFHDNEVFANAAGYVTDSFVGGHPGMPQDHAWLTRNRIHGNNSNYFKQFVQSGTCSGMPGERGYGQGTVCPAFPVPVGTGILIAGGNSNLVTENLIYDNWRAGAMLFWVPGAVRGDYAPQQQYDTSNGNHFTKNRMGFHPSGVTQPNGVDFSWDEQGIGNCWEGNVSSTGTITDDTQLLPLYDCASGGSDSPVGNLATTAQNAPCATYNREDEPSPPGCDWFDDPAMPAARQEAPGETAPAPAEGGGGAFSGDAGSEAPAAQPAARALPSTGSSLLPGVAGLLLAGAAYVVWRRRWSLA